MESIQDAGIFGVIVIAIGGLCTVLSIGLFVLRVFMKKNSTFLPIWPVLCLLPLGIGLVGTIFGLLEGEKVIARGYDLSIQDPMRLAIVSTADLSTYLGTMLSTFITTISLWFLGISLFFDKAPRRRSTLHLVCGGLSSLFLTGAVVFALSATELSSEIVFEGYRLMLLIIVPVLCFLPLFAAAFAHPKQAKDNNRADLLLSMGVLSLVLAFDKLYIVVSFSYCKRSTSTCSSPTFLAWVSAANWNLRKLLCSRNSSSSINSSGLS